MLPAVSNSLTRSVRSALNSSSSGRRGGRLDERLTATLGPHGAVNKTDRTRGGVVYASGVSESVQVIAIRSKSSARSLA